MPLFQAALRRLRRLDAFYRLFSSRDTARTAGLASAAPAAGPQGAVQLGASPAAPLAQWRRSASQLGLSFASVPLSTSG